MKYSQKILIILCVVMAFAIWTGDCRADHAEIHLNYLPWSEHHGDSDATNEDHNGVGLSVSWDNMTVGYMWYTNSYGDDGPLVHVTAFQKKCELCLGLGTGWAPAYSESDHSPIIGWVAIKYGFVTVLTAPTEVTAAVFSIPLH